MFLLFRGPDVTLLNGIRWWRCVTRVLIWLKDALLIAFAVFQLLLSILLLTFYCFRLLSGTFEEMTRSTLLLFEAVSFHLTVRMITPKLL